MRANFMPNALGMSLGEVEVGAFGIDRYTLSSNAKVVTCKCYNTQCSVYNTYRCIFICSDVQLSTTLISFHPLSFLEKRF